MRGIFFAVGCACARPKAAATSNRARFLAALQGLLKDRTEIGDGELGRLLRDLQRQHFHPPVKTAWD